MEREINKLVRDNIIDIILSNNQKPIYRILNEEEYKESLQRKLLEEVNEFLQSGEIVELADILEVVYALAKLKGYSIDKLEKIRQEKKLLNGEFNKKIYLESVQE